MCDLNSIQASRSAHARACSSAERVPSFPPRHASSNKDCLDITAEGMNTWVVDVRIKISRKQSPVEVQHWKKNGIGNVGNPAGIRSASARHPGPFSRHPGFCGCFRTYYLQHFDKGHPGPIDSLIILKRGIRRRMGLDFLCGP